MNESTVQQLLFVGMSLMLDVWNYHLAWRISIDLLHDPPSTPPVEPPRDCAA